MSFSNDRVHLCPIFCHGNELNLPYAYQVIMCINLGHNNVLAFATVGDYVIGQRGSKEGDFDSEWYALTEVVVYV